MATTECDRFHLSLLTWLQSFEHGCSFLFWNRLNSVVSATLLWQYRVRLQNGVEEDFWRFIYLTVYACWYLQARVKEQLNSCKPGRTKTTKKKSTRTVLGEKSQSQTDTDTSIHTQTATEWEVMEWEANAAVWHENQHCVTWPLCTHTHSHTHRSIANCLDLKQIIWKKNLHTDISSIHDITDHRFTDTTHVQADRDC